jgi:hypothetical protein
MATARKKIRFQPEVNPEVADKLIQDAEANTRKPGPHIAHILKEYAKDLPYTPKKEYKK